MKFQELNSDEMNKIINLFSLEKEIIDSLDFGTYNVYTYIQTEYENELVYLVCGTTMIVKERIKLIKKGFLGLFKKFKKERIILQLPSEIKEISEDFFLNSILLCREGKYKNTIVQKTLDFEEIHIKDFFQEK